jgi:hypothetical protein
MTPGTTDARINEIHIILRGIPLEYPAPLVSQTIASAGLLSPSVVNAFFRVTTIDEGLSTLLALLDLSQRV